MIQLYEHTPITLQFILTIHLPYKIISKEGTGYEIDFITFKAHKQCATKHSFINRVTCCSSHIHTSPSIALSKPPRACMSVRILLNMLLLFECVFTCSHSMHFSCMGRRVNECMNACVTVCAHSCALLSKCFFTFSCLLGSAVTWPLLKNTRGSAEKN